jgi:hypothetical protein
MKCEWKGCKKEAVTNIMFNEGDNTYVQFVCEEHLITTSKMTDIF